MFAKLKKKVIEENGGRTLEAGDRSPSLSSLPGSVRRDSATPTAVHSPVSKEPPAGGGGGGDLKAAYSMERLAPSSPAPSEDSGGRNNSMSKEDLKALLTKRTEQCKKMEGNISDLAALIKDKNKTMEQLERQTKQHEDVLNQRLSEQKAEFEAYRDKLISGYQEDKLALDKDKQELAKKLQVAEEYRETFFKRELDSDEIQDFTVQELAKVKHMLIMAQTELEKCRKELETKSELLTSTQSREKQLDTDYAKTKEKADTLEKECERLTEDNNERAELVTSLSKEKSAFEKRVDQLTREMTEKQSQIAKLNHQLSELDNNYRALEHSSEMHRNKTSKLLEEKEDHINLLQERVNTLEKRLTGQSLSGDDRVTALQAEREGLEKKLSETRQQLTEIKSTWSDKISHLEAQISHLNTKIMEDSEELASNQRAADSMRDNFHKQIEDLRRQLEDAEKRALENYELASGKDTHHEHQVRELESQLSHARLACVDMETQLRSKITSLEVQLTELQTARQAEHDDLRNQLEQEKRQNEESMERELHHEQTLKAAEARCAELESKVSTQQEELSRLREELKARNQSSDGQGLKVTELEKRVEELQAEVGAHKTDLSSARRQFNHTDQEKGELMVRNAQLSQQLTALQQRVSEQRSDAESQLTDRDQTIQGQQDSITQLQDRIEGLQTQVQELESLNAAMGSTDQLELTIRGLQDQLADKTRTLKKQEQTVKDLRQTLQRELKVQALPNDDASDDNNVPSPSTNRKFPPRQAVPPRSVSPQPPQSTHHNMSSFGSAVLPVSSSVTSSSATAAVKPMTLTSVMQVSHERGVVVRRDLEQDVNFQYLKHVVLKFMLSREAEAVQLIKAVAVLLNFTHQEQQMIKQTLEWKMSWFGSRPSLGKGQKAKVVPPNY
ncbi:golgin subfamily A member 1-like isoform X2 [Littorina saxatilis]|uniref:Golgin subfamily A member 1 n=1 Tax=Littorina saxatilis TaxID=31220 RepID=A0AAN9AX47_9CAEN